MPGWRLRWRALTCTDISHCPTIPGLSMWPRGQCQGTPTFLVQYRRKKAAAVRHRLFILTLALLTRFSPSINACILQEGQQSLSITCSTFFYLYVGVSRTRPSSRCSFLSPTLVYRPRRPALLRGSSFSCLTTQAATLKRHIIIKWQSPRHNPPDSAPYETLFTHFAEFRWMYGAWTSNSSCNRVVPSPNKSRYTSFCDACGAEMPIFWHRCVFRFSESEIKWMTKCSDWLWCRKWSCSRELAVKHWKWMASEFIQVTWWEKWSSGSFQSESVLGSMSEAISEPFYVPPPSSVTACSRPCRSVTDHLITHTYRNIPGYNFISCSIF